MKIPRLIQQHFPHCDTQSEKCHVRDIGSGLREEEGQGALPLSQKRDTAIDILKGWSIIAIMLLHYEQGIFSGAVNAWIGSFMVSAFYLTAAWVLALKPLPTVREALPKLWRGLGWPYISLSVLICSFSLLLCVCRQMSWEILVRDVYKFLVLRGIGTLWFLPALFFGQLLFLCFVRQKLTVKFLMLAMTMLFVALYWRWQAEWRDTSTLMQIIDAPMNEFWRIGNAWVSIAVFYAFAKSCRKQIEELSAWQLFLSSAIILAIYTTLISGSLLVEYGLLTGWLGPIGLLFLAKATQKQFLNRPFEYFGRNSLLVMALHFSILQQICIVINRHWTGQPALTGFHALIYFVISLIFMPILITFCRKCPLLLR